jgi:simple sugar transport system ATP-binding protein
LAVLLVSADLDELIGLSDTLWVILRGALVAQLDPATMTQRMQQFAHTDAVTCAAYTPDEHVDDFQLVAVLQVFLSNRLEIGDCL